MGPPRLRSRYGSGHVVHRAKCDRMKHSRGGQQLGTVCPYLSVQAQRPHRLAQKTGLLVLRLCQRHLNLGAQQSNRKPRKARPRA